MHRRFVPVLLSLFVLLVAETKAMTQDVVADAAAVAQALVGKGIDASRLRPAGADGGPPSGRAVVPSREPDRFPAV